MMKKQSVRTNTHIEFQDITDWVRKEVRESGIKEGICVVYVPHTTAGVTINENADPAVVGDIITHTSKLISERERYQHMEGNSPAHIKASLFGFSQSIIINGGDLVLGTWQGIYFCEFDGPRTRNVYLQIVPA
ncbi:MAG: secondary thiamine-phosphate synthase enzyme YjbQ [Candidatus Xenobiia bacterium LiM19]